MKLPDDVRKFLARRFQNKLGHQLLTDAHAKPWPMDIALDMPNEALALKQVEGVRAWVQAWQAWQAQNPRGLGRLQWCERRWKTLGVQCLPEKLLLPGPAALAIWLGQGARWARAQERHSRLTARWPALAPILPKHFDVLADYDDADHERFMAILAWLLKHPNSKLYPRQLPVHGVDSKWLDGRKGLLMDWLAALQGQDTACTGLDFYQRCGLRAPPRLVRLRVLDPCLRAALGGLGDITAPVQDLAGLTWQPAHVLVVENLQTGLAMADLPGTVVLMGLGYHVDVLAHLPWLARAQCLYWGDLDTHGFAILHRARGHVPGLKSVLMDEDTLLTHKALWGQEKVQHPAAELALLGAEEQQVYCGLKQQRWGQTLRLEQERIDWATAWGVLQGLVLDKA